jgi:hypothetical protein
MRRVAAVSRCPDRSGELRAAYDALLAVPIRLAGIVRDDHGLNRPVPDGPTAEALIAAAERVLELQGAPCEEGREVSCASCQARREVEGEVRWPLWDAHHDVDDEAWHAARALQLAPWPGKWEDEARYWTGRLGGPTDDQT